MDQKLFSIHYFDGDNCETPSHGIQLCRGNPQTHIDRIEHWTVEWFDVSGDEFEITYATMYANYTEALEEYLSAISALYESTHTPVVTGFLKE